MTWLYIIGKNQSWTVGFYDPKGEWHTESNYDTSVKAAERVHYLNGGDKDKQEIEVGEKYELTDETITTQGRILHRIKALRNFGNVSKGDVGGYIECEDNLSHEGNAWIDENAWVYGNAMVYGKNIW